MVRCTLTDLNCVDLQYCPFLVSLDAFSGSCKSGNDISASICFPNKTRDINVRAIKMIANLNEAKTLVNANPIVQHVIQI